MKVNIAKFNRIIWLDILRSICIILMVLEHIVILTLKLNAGVFNLNSEHSMYSFVNFCDSIFSSHFLHNFKYIVVGIFFFVSGVSFNLSRNNNKRFVKLLIAALFINLITYLLYKSIDFDCLVIFGILHSISFCILIWIFLSKINSENIKVIIAFLFLVISIILIFLKPTIDNNNAFMWLGIPETNYRSGFDYFPIFPWITIYSFGVLLNVKPKKNREEYKKNRKYYFVLPSIIIGKYSLYIYLLHIPIIIGILLMCFKFS